MNNEDKVWWHNWSTFIVKPNIWWRLKYLFNPHDLIFCWGIDKYFTKGFTGQNYFSCGGVPTSERDRNIR